MAEFLLHIGTSEKRQEWNMLAIIDYGFIAAFFIILFCLVLLIAKTQTEEQSETAAQAQASRKPTKHVIEYGIIAALLGFFLFLTVLIERSNTHPGAS
jgi:NADH:ubiquinone oxidoreductase subunit 6 (subunit J)